MEILTLDRNPRLESRIDELSRRSWPEFLLHGDVRGWRALFTTFAAWQILILEKEGEIARVSAAGHTVPIRWSGESGDIPDTITGIIARAEEARARDLHPTALVPLAALVHPDFRGRGRSATLVRAMLDLAATHRIPSVLAPVRPTRKAEHPLVPMETYLGWKRDDGAPFDPWVRVHLRLGAEILRIAPRTLTVEGSIADWEKWTGMSFPATGQYAVPGALQPVSIDRERDLGRYEDPNVWMLHRVALAGPGGGPRGTASPLPPRRGLR